MPNKFLLKRNGVAGTAPASTDLLAGEPAVNTADATMYVKKDDGTVVAIGGNVWDGTVNRARQVCSRFCEYATTDSNGRIVFKITKDGTTTGVAIFSAILSINLTGVTPSTTSAAAAPFFVVEAQTTKTITVRAIKGVALLALGNTVGYGGSGLGCYIDVSGLI